MLRTPLKFSKQSKIKLRKIFLSKRKKKYYDVSKKHLLPLMNYIKKRFQFKKKIFVAIYYPSNYEINLIKIFKKINEGKIIILLPVIKKGYSLDFVPWTSNQALLINKYGIPEPKKNDRKNYFPDIILVPMLAFDRNKNRLGYGKGYYDRYLNNLIKLNKKIEAIGVAFSFQESNRLPISNHDFKLNKIYTENGFVK